MDYESTAHAKYLLLSHLIFVCKCRKKLLIAYGEEMKRIFKEIATKSDFSFETLEASQDHLHCLVKSNPRLSPVAIVRETRSWNQPNASGISMRPNCESIFGRSEHFGVMDTFVAQLAMPARIPSVALLNNRGEGGQFIHEAEDFAVFLPSFYKRGNI